MRTPTLVVMGALDPDFSDPEAEARWIAGRRDAEVVMVPESGHYPHAQRPDLVGRAVVVFTTRIHGCARAGLTTERVVRAAAEMADEHGWSQLTLAALASRLGVRQPSLYKHINSLDGLHRGISVLAKRELGQVISRAAVGRAGRDALVAVCVA